MPLAARTASRMAVTTPSFGLMSPRDLPPGLVDDVAEALERPPALAARAEVHLFAGYVGPLRTVESADPPPGHPRLLVWGTEDARHPIDFVLFDQQADDRATNQLFVIAILLGTAIPCLVHALQLALRSKPPRESAAGAGR